MTKKEIIQILHELYECTKQDGMPDKYKDGVNFSISFIAFAMTWKKTEYENIDLERLEEKSNKLLNKIRKDNI